MLDYWIKNGFLVDGSGFPGRHASIGIQGGRIARILPADASMPARHVIDAAGRHIFPGFIDLHTHSDHTLFLDGRGMSFLRQGVTLDTMGNCGYSAAPLGGQGVLAKNVFCYTPSDKPVTWGSMEEYFRTLETAGLRGRVAALVGHSALRSHVMGYSNRPATKDELEQMCSLLQLCYDQGAAGFSTGLEYFPGKAAQQDELQALCRVTAKNDRLYATHIRNRDRFYRQGYQEAIDMARETGVRVQISHAIPKYGVPKEGAAWIVEAVEKARTDSDVAYDIIPFLWGPTSLTAILPAELLALPTQELIHQLRQPSVRRALRERSDCIWQLIVDRQWDLVKLQHCSNSRQYIGKTLRQIGEERNQDPFDALLDIIVEEGPAMYSGLISGRLRSQEDSCLLLSQPYCGVISDAMALAKDGPLSQIIWSDGCFSWISALLRTYVYQTPLLSLEEAIRRITSLPAQRLGLSGIGVLEEGSCADLAIMDLSAYLSPRAGSDYAQGLSWLFVDGQPVVEQDTLLTACPGSVLRFSRAGNS